MGLKTLLNHTVAMQQKVKLFFLLLLFTIIIIICFHVYLFSPVSVIPSRQLKTTTACIEVLQYTILQYVRRFYSSPQRILSSLRIYYGRHGRFEHCKATSAAGSLAHNLLTVFLLPPLREEEDLFSGTIIPVLKQRGGIFPLGFLCSPII